MTTTLPATQNIVAESTTIIDNFYIKLYNIYNLNGTDVTTIM